MLAQIFDHFRRVPDVVIGGKDNPYLLRWHLIPRNRWFNIYLHKFLRSDDDRALHDHPWASCSVILRGGYREHFPSGIIKPRRVGDVVFRAAEQMHRVELYLHYAHHHMNLWGLHYADNKELYKRIYVKQPKPCWTLFITGPKVREWGFNCPHGWRHWRDFCDPNDPGQTGKGCE